MRENNMPGGYNGKILRANLTTGTTTIEQLDEEFCRKYVGGAGFIAYYLYEELAVGIDPLGPDNKLIFANGPMTGTTIGGTARNCIGAKSVLTGSIAKSEVGGFWGAELDHAGFDGIIVEGKAEKPVYLWLHDGEVSIRDASNLWGKSTKETVNAIIGELGDNKIRVASIGPAGENMVHFASIMNGLHDAAGRGGVGAIMGSKNLKAVAVRGHRNPRVANPAGVKSIQQWLMENQSLWANFAVNGTAGTGTAIDMAVKSGNISVKNFREGIFPEAIEADCQLYKSGMRGCFACPVRCKKVMSFDEPSGLDPDYGGPEYESIGSLGTNCYISDMKAISKGNELCNAYSLDTISTGMVISFAMECYENGLLTRADTGGIDLKFGNAEAMLEVIELIAKRKSIGDLLANGTLKAAQKIGNGADKFAMQVKGLEIPMHEPRLKAGLGLGYMINPHGADHCFNMQDTFYAQPGRKAELVKSLGLDAPLPRDDISPRKVALFRNEHLTRLLQDCLPVCMFLPYSLFQVVDMTAAVTGWRTSIMEQLKVAERVMTTMRLLNLRDGLTARDDCLPKRFFSPKSGVLSETSLDYSSMERAKRYYYTLMGWNPDNGVPLPEKVEELAIP